MNKTAKLTHCLCPFLLLHAPTTEQLSGMVQKLAIILSIQCNLVNSTPDNSKTCLTRNKLNGPCLGNDNLLGISRTFSYNSNRWTAVSAIKLPFLWLDVFTFLCNELNFVVFFSHEIKVFKKFSQEMEYTKVKWTHYGGHMAKAKREHNS